MDFIRGLAVLGLVFINCYSFAIFELNYTPLTTPPLSDKILQTLSLIFVEGRFRTLFTLLFGAGLYIQFQRQLTLFVVSSVPTYSQQLVMLMQDDLRIEYQHLLG